MAKIARPKARPFMTESVPLYYQLGSLLREKIVSGQLAAGSRIPTEAELSLEYGVSRITVRQALAAMEEDDLIRREAGRGTFVTEHVHFTESLKVEGSLNDLIFMGQTTSVKLLDVKTVQATADQAAALQVEPKSPVVWCTRLRLHQDEPFSYIVSILPKEIGRQITSAEWKKGSILQLLEEKLGIPLVDADQTVRASMADAGMARLLETRVGAPLLAIDRVVRTDGERPVVSVHTYYRSDIYSFQIHLVREHSADAPGVQRGWALKRPVRRS